MSTYKTPGVYVEEISTLPPSIAEVATAIPAFIGVTQIVPEDGEFVPVKINSMLEYKDYFGTYKPYKYEIEIKRNASANSLEILSLGKDKDAEESIMFYALKLYFSNGGGPCYIAPLKEGAEIDGYKQGLEAVAKIDEVTLLVCPDAIRLGNEYYMLCQKILQQCSSLKDRFGIFDVLINDEEKVETAASKFRQGVVGDLKYGAAYLPYLNSSFKYGYDENQVEVNYEQFYSLDLKDSSNSLRVSYIGKSTDPQVEIKTSPKSKPSLAISVVGNILTISCVMGSTKNKVKSSIEEILQDWKEWTRNNDSGGFSLDSIAYLKAHPSLATGNKKLVKPGSTKLDQLKDSNTDIYNFIKAELNKPTVTIPPSAAMAGIYAQIDRDRGVWKSPANVAIMGVLGPKHKINQSEQDNLNIDPTSGKSINAIRSFSGKGTLVWGARTLAGNDNEWRYVSVRRLFNMIEESAQKSTSFAVFEANDTTTWLKVKAMIDSYLFGLWQQGALAGPTPEQAYFVNVGLGKTMTPQDILEGRMIVDIGIAAVRPAEFIILRFSHKLQEA